MELRFLRCARTHLRWSGLHGRRRPQGDSVTQSVCPPPTRYPAISACSVCLMSPRGILHGCFRVTEKTHRSFSNADGVGLLLPTVAPPQRSNARQASLPERPPCRVWSMRASGCTARGPSREPRRGNRGVQAGGGRQLLALAAAGRLDASRCAASRYEQVRRRAVNARRSRGEDGRRRPGPRAGPARSGGRARLFWKAACPRGGPVRPRARHSEAVGTPHGRS